MKNIWIRLWEVVIESKGKHIDETYFNFLPSISINNTFFVVVETTMLLWKLPLL